MVLTRRNELTSPRDGIAMKQKMTVTDKKLAANRRNAQLSTGPRTVQGKDNSKFNAVTIGLFAKYVVIPMCDGQASRSKYNRLLADLRMELSPVGTVEGFYVEEMAKSMWRLRRAARAEGGSAQHTARVNLKYLPGYYDVAQPYLDRQKTLTDAASEIKRTGTLSKKSLEAVLPLLKLREEAVPALDDKFRQTLETEVCFLSSVLEKALEEWEDKLRDFYASHALASDEVLRKIFRYEKTAQRKFDWALKNLLDSQRRRRKAQAAGWHAQEQKNVKRTQQVSRLQRHLQIGAPRNPRKRPDAAAIPQDPQVSAMTL